MQAFITTQLIPYSKTTTTAYSSQLLYAKAVPLDKANNDTDHR